MWGEGLASTYSAADRAVVRRWQGLDRFYQRIQSPRVGDVRALRFRDLLDDVVRRHTLPTEIRVWRGVRSCELSLGAPLSALPMRLGSTSAPNRFVSTSLDIAVAQGEFTHPPAFGGAALLRVIARSGTPALWLPPIGDPKLAYQQELLFPPDVRMTILATVPAASGPPTVIVRLEVVT